MPHKWVFLYRRKDSAFQTGRIFDVLDARFPGEVFRDVESIDIGANWLEELRQSVLSADVLVVVMGPEWYVAGIVPGGRRPECLIPALGKTPNGDVMACRGNRARRPKAGVPDPRPRQDAERGRDGMSRESCPEAEGRSA